MQVSKNETFAMKVNPAFWLIGIFIISLAPNLVQGEALWWEAANAFGFVGFAGLLILLANGYSKSGHSHFHRWFGITVLVAMLVHSLWFLIADAAVLEYLLPGAPVYMVLGISALLFCILLTVSSFRKLRRVAYVSTRSFRFWHNWQSIVIVILSSIHIASSGFYFVSTWQWLALGTLSALSFLLPAKPTTARKGEQRQSLGETSLLLIICTLFIGLFIFLR